MNRPVLFENDNNLCKDIHHNTKSPIEGPQAFEETPCFLARLAPGGVNSREENTMKRIRTENFEYLRKQHTKIFAAYQEFGRSIHEEGGPLEERERSLIKVAISAAGRHELALSTHIEKALAAGCTGAEIEHAILLTAPTAGFPTMMAGLLVLREELSRG